MNGTLLKKSLYISRFAHEIAPLFWLSPGEWATLGVYQQRGIFFLPHAKLMVNSPAI
jgi:hypothetical protein